MISQYESINLNKLKLISNIPLNCVSFGVLFFYKCEDVDLLIV